MDEDGRNLALLKKILLDFVSLTNMISRRYFCNLMFW